MSRINRGRFSCLNNNDVISKQISDHHPVIHDGVLFWNIMMQGNRRNGGLGFNNGFGLIESDKEYSRRLTMVAEVIAEAVYQDSSIEVISLCEGPIKSEHTEVLFQALMKFPCMTRFERESLMFHKPAAVGQNWGLLMLADTRYAVTEIHYDLLENQPKLVNRFQLWKLTQPGESRYLALAHFPFAGDEHKTVKRALSVLGQEYCGLIKDLMDYYNNDHFVFCADFNFNPYLIKQWNEYSLDEIPHNNSILLTGEGGDNKHTTNAVTVDGVLLSGKEKQKYHSSRPESNLFGRLKAEYRFFQSHVKSLFLDLVQNEHAKLLVN